MKLIVEVQDIKAVKAVANDCWGVTLTDEEVVILFEKNHLYAAEVYKWGPDDTETRTSLGQALQRMGKLDDDLKPPRT